MSATVKVGDGFKKILDAVMKRKEVDSTVASDMIASTYAGRVNAVRRWAKKHAEETAKGGKKRKAKAPKAKAPKAKAPKAKAPKVRKKAAPAAQAQPSAAPAAA